MAGMSGGVRIVAPRPGRSHGNRIMKLQRLTQGRSESRDGKANAGEGKKVNSNINVTPMVDVMLVLLIIFMVITPMLNNKVNVDLPKADAAVVMEDANKEDAITVAVTRDGKTFLGADQVRSMIWAPRSPPRWRTRVLGL